MSTAIDDLNKSFQKAQVVNVRSGDSVHIHQKIREGNKERVQVFSGLVIRTSKRGGHLSRITVRRMSGGVGVEKSFLMNSPLVVKVEVTKRSKVRKNYLSYMRERTGKSARLSGIDFDREAVNKIDETKPDTKEVSVKDVVNNEQPKTESEAKEK